MDIIVTGRKIQVSEKMKDYVHEKIGTAMKVFDIEPTSAEVVLRKQTDRGSAANIAEVTLRTKGHVIRAEGIDEDLFCAIDVASDKLSRQLRKFKTKVVDRRSKNKAGDKPYANVADLQAAAAVALAPEAPLAIEEEDEAVLRVKYVELKNMSEEEALIQIDLLGHDFFVYNDALTGLTNVMYRRAGGGYGIIKPALPEAEAAI